MPISRRKFTQLVSGAGAAAALPLPAEAQGSLFQHGIASGDPLQDRVILWTRISPAVEENSLFPVSWVVSADSDLRTAYRSGVAFTNATADYTVKVDVTGLQPNQTWYYQFSTGGALSPVGRTRTLPELAFDRLRFAVVSCSNYAKGYFNVYRLIANRQDLQFVLHLGDYIYENAGSSVRTHQPDRELITLADYRQRHAQYRTDPDLQELHRQHPVIAVWDDHESANNAWQFGAENHQPDTEGAWLARRAAATQAWAEWLPVRSPVASGLQIYRSFRLGDLADLMMLDTRLIGRDRQLSPLSPALADPSRTLLGFDQENWLLSQLDVSQARGARWRILGQQVMVAQLLGPEGAVVNPDQWDGYPAARTRLLTHLANAGIVNTVVLTGDLHSSWGNEISSDPYVPGYVSQAVEFVTPGVTSESVDTPQQAQALERALKATQPHVKYADLCHRGYLLMDIDRERAQGEWYHVRTVTERSAEEDLAMTLRTASGQNRLTTPRT